MLSLPLTAQKGILCDRVWNEGGGIQQTQIGFVGFIVLEEGTRKVHILASHWNSGSDCLFLDACDLNLWQARSKFDDRWM